MKEELNERQAKNTGNLVQEETEDLWEQLKEKEKELQEAGRLVDKWMGDLKKSKEAIEEVKVVWEIRARARTRALEEEKKNLDNLYFLDQI